MKAQLGIESLKHIIGLRNLVGS